MSTPLFYQTNPYGSQWGHMSWGHAVSTDLLHWQELPVAIAEDERVSIFSGSVVVDTHNSSGFGDDPREGSTPPLVAIYTGCLRRPEGGQAQELAYSLDRGRTWTKYAHNPVLDLALRDFRDPKVFWHTPTARWVMVVVLPSEHTAQFYASHDLKAWHWLGNFKAAFESAGIWECPDLMPFVTDTGESTWLFKVDVLAGHPSGGSGARLLFGQFDGTRFTADTHTAPTWADWGADFYAALSWSTFPGAPQRQLWLAWMSCHRYAQHLPTAPWRGVMSLPRELRVQRSAQGLQLLQQPLPALQTLRGVGHTLAALVLEGAEGAAEGAAETAAEHALWPEAPNTAIDGRLWGLQIDLQLELQSCTGGRCGVLLRAAADDSGAATVVGYDAERGMVFIDRSHSGFNPPGDPLYAKAREAPVRPPQPDRPLRLRVLLDWSSVEVFVDNGHTVLTEQIFPAHRHRSLRLFAQGGTARFGPARAWPLQAARYTQANA